MTSPRRRRLGEPARGDEQRLDSSTLGVVVEVVYCTLVYLLPIRAEGGEPAVGALVTWRLIPVQ